MDPERERPRLPHELHVQLLVLLAGLPGVAFALYALWSGAYGPNFTWPLTILILGLWLGCTLLAGERVAAPLRTISSLLEAMREGDYSIRARGALGRDALAEVMQQMNEMGGTLRSQRLGAMEATTLLKKVIEEIDVAIFAFNEEQRLKLVNPAGERLLAQPGERILGLNAAALGLSEFLNGEPERTVQRVFPGGAGRWGISRSSFREGGLPHRLLVLSDLTRPLREEELQAWQRLVRVLGHELNNSLAPIKSIAGSLETLARRDPLPPDWRDDMQRGLSVIAARSEALARFLGAYAELARLPRPAIAPVDVRTWVERAARFETRMRVQIEPGPDALLAADSDQLDQMLINLLRNAVDAALETGGTVGIEWAVRNAFLDLQVRDEGPGLAATANLFVPFFTTKPSGSGIGLVLSRQIAEAHGGTLRLENRVGRKGCVAIFQAPILRREKN